VSGIVDQQVRIELLEPAQLLRDDLALAQHGLPLILVRSQLLDPLPPVSGQLDACHNRPPVAQAHLLGRTSPAQGMSRRAGPPCDDSIATSLCLR
jgi:hypothetical protein